MNKNNNYEDKIPYRIATFEAIKEKLNKEHEEKIKELDLYIYQTENSYINITDNLETIVCKLYLQLNNMVDVSKELNELGYRIEVEHYNGKIVFKKYESNDIRNIILNSELGNLSDAAKGMYDRNYNNKARISRW